MLINVSTRRFKRSVRLPEGDVPASDGAGLSKSATSRRFVALSAARLTGAIDKGGGSTRDRGFRRMQNAPDPAYRRLRRMRYEPPHARQ